MRAVLDSIGSMEGFDEVQWISYGPPILAPLSFLEGSGGWAPVWQELNAGAMMGGSRSSVGAQVE